MSGEVKWQKITENYKQKYINLMSVFFDLIEEDKIKVRIMFTQNMFAAINLTTEQKEDGYFRLYYQFLKHAFGLKYREPRSGSTRIRLLLDQLPDTKEKAEKFKGYVAGLSKNPEFRDAGLLIMRDDINDAVSHEHDLLQCLDVVLGAMQFRLNDKHKEIPPGQKRRGKRTRAKEDVFKYISSRIRKIHPGFNIGISTGTNGSLANRWSQPYRHWLFVPAEHAIVGTSKHKKT